MKRWKIIERIMKLGGSGSGNWGHAGRPGRRGGSMPSRGGGLSNQELKMQQAEKDAIRESLEASVPGESDAQRQGREQEYVKAARQGEPLPGQLNPRDIPGSSLARDDDTAVLRGVYKDIKLPGGRGIVYQVAAKDASGVRKAGFEAKGRVGQAAGKVDYRNSNFTATGNTAKAAFDRVIAQARKTIIVEGDRIFFKDRTRDPDWLEGKGIYQ